MDRENREWKVKMVGKTKQVNSWNRRCGLKTSDFVFILSSSICVLLFSINYHHREPTWLYGLTTDYDWAGELLRVSWAFLKRIAWELLLNTTMFTFKNVIFPFSWILLFSLHHHHSVKRQLCSVAAAAITSNWIVYSSLSLHFYIGITVITKFFWLNLLIALSCYFEKLLLTLSLPRIKIMQLPSINFFPHSGHKGFERWRWTKFQRDSLSIEKNWW